MNRDPARQGIQIAGVSLYKTGIARFDIRDPYHLAVTSRWTTFFAGFLGVFCLLNLGFGLLYRWQPDSIGNARSLRDAFFFSVETMATVGYGTMVPATTYGHLLSMTEILIGLTFTAIFTGLIFVRFSKVKPRVLFADRLVVSRHDGAQTLMLRLAYGRGALVAASARMHVLKKATTAEGRTYRTTHELKLVRSHAPIVVLTWTLMHTIDEHSPLHGMSAQDLVDGEVGVFITLAARDHDLASDIYDFKAYAPSEVEFGAVYRDLYTRDATNIGHVDLTKLSLTQAE